MLSLHAEEYDEDDIESVTQAQTVNVPVPESEESELSKLQETDAELFEALQYLPRV